MKRTILALILLLAGTAPASAAFLGANSPLGESFLNTGIEKVAGDVSLEVPMGCGRAWLERTAECFVAPGAMAGSGLSGGSSAAATYPAKFMEGAADVGEGTPLAESVEIEIPVTFEGFAAPGPEAQAFVNRRLSAQGLKPSLLSTRSSPAAAVRAPNRRPPRPVRPQVIPFPKTRDKSSISSATPKGTCRIPPRIGRCCKGSRTTPRQLLVMTHTGIPGLQGRTLMERKRGSRREMESS